MTLAPSPPTGERPAVFQPMALTMLITSEENDVINFLGDTVCKRVEYLNIRGHRCSDCNLPWWQGGERWFLHTDSTATTCGFDPTAGAVSSEDNFGYYGAVNSNFRCTAYASATNKLVVWWKYCIKHETFMLIN